MDFEEIYQLKEESIWSKFKRNTKGKSFGEKLEKLIGYYLFDTDKWDDISELQKNYMTEPGLSKAEKMQRTNELASIWRKFDGNQGYYSPEEIRAARDLNESKQINDEYVTTPIKEAYGAYVDDNPDGDFSEFGPEPREDWTSNPDNEFKARMRGVRIDEFEDDEFDEFLKDEGTSGPYTDINWAEKYDQDFSKYIDNEELVYDDFEKGILSKEIALDLLVNEFGYDRKETEEELDDIEYSNEQNNLQQDAWKKAGLDDDSLDDMGNIKDMSIEDDSFDDDFDEEDDWIDNDFDEDDDLDEEWDTGPQMSDDLDFDDWDGDDD